jgi:uncharacterized membrane protein YkvI
MKFNSKKILFCFIVIFLIALPIFQLSAANAALENAQKGMYKTASPQGAGLTNKALADIDSKKEVRTITTNAVGYILSFIGIILLINLIFAGYQWMNSGGNEETITKSKEKIKSSLIGLIIIVAAYIITDLIFSSLDTILTV